MPYQTGEMAIIGNVLRGGQSTEADLPLVTIGGSGDVALYEHDNIAVDRWGRPLPMRGLVHQRADQDPQAAAADDSGRHAAARARRCRTTWSRTPARATGTATTKTRASSPTPSRAAATSSTARRSGAAIRRQRPTYQAFDAAEWNLETTMTPKKLGE